MFLCFLLNTFVKRHIYGVPLRLSAYALVGPQVPPEINEGHVMSQAAC